MHVSLTPVDWLSFHTRRPYHEVIKKNKRQDAVFKWATRIILVSLVAAGGFAAHKAGVLPKISRL